MGFFAKIPMEGVTIWTLQFRAVDDGIEMKAEAPAPITTMLDVGIQYCPWCGVKLDKFYRKSIEDLRRDDLGITGERRA